MFIASFLGHAEINDNAYAVKEKRYKQECGYRYSDHDDDESDNHDETKTFTHDDHDDDENDKSLTIKRC